VQNGPLRFTIAFQMWKGFGHRILAAALVALLMAPAFAAGKPEVRSAIALIADAKSGEVLYELKGTSVVPIASITKLMTALVVLDAQQPLDEVIEITAADRWKGKGAHSRLPIGAKITRADLLRLALMASENRAAHVLGRNYPGGITQFVKTMNLKAKVLGMKQTRFADASGLSSLNVSSARDLAKLVNAAAREVVIRQYSTLGTVEVRAGKHLLTYRNTNLLVGKPDWQILVQKTGFTHDAGECLVQQALIGDRTVNMIFMNSWGKLTRTADARRVRRWMDARAAAPMVVGAK
jgi:D-alanyl-D-alanine endopeptidase (penicillin-binding protein 7)